ncbi:uncharacterized protein [Dermacentor albipictus]
MNCVREMLSNDTQLFLKWGVGGTFSNNRTICWTSNRSDEYRSLGYPRHERFYNTVEAEDRWQERNTMYYVGLVKSIPSVIVESKKGGADDPEVNGTFTLLFATSQCYVMGKLQVNESAEAINSTKPFTDNSTCLLWAQRHGNETVKKLCEPAFISNCSGIPGPVYKRGHGVCNCTDGIGSEED